MCCAGGGDGSARIPKVTMKDEHGRRDRPTEDDLAVATNAFVRKDAVGAFLNPIYHILSASWPEKTHTNAEQSFIDAEVAADGTAMEDIEDEAAQGGGNNDEEQRGAGL